jgi:alpha-glucosidase
MRSHTELGTPDKEPWAFGAKYEDINRRTIELRYELLPYIYNVMQQASETGDPALRPLFVEFPNDERADGIDDEFLFGSDLLVAPILWEGFTSRQVYLPAGDWFDYWTGRKYRGDATIQVRADIDSIPIFVRGGGFIFRQPVVQNTGQMSGQPLRVLIAPARESESSYYEDDGESMEYRRGDFVKRRFYQNVGADGSVVEISAPEGNYRPAARDLVLQAWMDSAPQLVAEQTGQGAAEELPRMDEDELARSARGWSFANGMLTVKDKDKFEATRFTVKP